MALSMDFKNIFAFKSYSYGFCWLLRVKPEKHQSNTLLYYVAVAGIIYT